MLKRNILIILLIFGFSILSFSQNQQKIDSLIQLTYSSPKDTNLVNAYEKLNGTFSFESEPGFGTKLKFEV